MHKTRLNPNDLPPVEVSTLRRILASVKPHRRRAALVISCMVAAAALNLCLPWFMRRVVDEAIPRGDLLEAVWGYSYEGGSNVVDVVIGGLRKKLGAYATTIETVTKVGYRFRRP